MKQEAKPILREKSWEWFRGLGGLEVSLSAASEEEVT